MSPIVSCVGSLGPLLVAMCPKVMEPLEGVASLEEVFWEPCSLVSDQHTTTCPVGFLGVSHLWKRIFTQWSMGQQRNLQNLCTVQALVSHYIVVSLGDF